MFVSVKLLGAKELDRKLRKLEPKIGKKVIKGALREAAKMILKVAKQKVPVDTGALKKDLKVRAMKRKKGRYGVLIGTAAGWGKGKTFYGAYLEFGTSKRPAKPFLRPAFDETKEAVIRRLKRRLKVGIERAARGKA